MKKVISAFIFPLLFTSGYTADIEEHFPFNTPHAHKGSQTSSTGVEDSTRHSPVHKVQRSETTDGQAEEVTDPFTLYKMGIEAKDAKRYEETRQYLEQAARQGYKPAQWKAMQFYSQSGPARDDERAFYWAKQIVDQGEDFIKGEENLPREKKFLKMVKHFLPKMFDEALDELAFCYRYGYGVEKDLEKAKGIYEEFLTRRDDPRRREIYNKISLELYTDQQREQGRSYELITSGALDDNIEANIVGLKKSAAEGVISSIYMLALVLEDGGPLDTKLKPNLDEAMRLYKIGSEAGDSRCMNNLGRIYLQRGNLTEARRLFEQAISLGNKEAPINLEKLAQLEH